jgi:1-acyl-sn-glycerol-3-phosphate acyltransferase
VTLLRSVLYAVTFLLWTLVLALAYLPALLAPRRWMPPLARFWLRGVMAIMRGTIRLGYEVRGAENLPAGAAIIAAKHQSAFETFALPLIIRDPAFVLKRELQWLPFFGWYLAKSGMIAIDRGAGAAALKAMVRGAGQAAEQGRSIVVFPEGTRTPPGERRPYHTGIAMLYGALNLPVVPVALNSGLFWGRRRFLKRGGRVIIEILPPIAPGLDRKRFMAELQSRIETTTDRLVAEGGDSERM